MGKKQKEIPAQAVSAFSLIIQVSLPSHYPSQQLSLPAIFYSLISTLLVYAV
jgi:hypothetical protein